MLASTLLRRPAAALALLLSGGFAFAADAPAGPRTDLLGDPLPAGAVARMGSGRLRQERMFRFVFSPDGKSLVSGGQHGLRVWDTTTGKLRWRLPFEMKWGLAFVFTADGLAVANGALESKSVTVRVFDPASGKVVRRTELPRQVLFHYLTFSPDGKRLAGAADEAVWVYDVATGREALRISRAAGADAYHVHHVAFAPDGKSLAVCGLSDTVRVYDTAGGSKLLRTLQRDGDDVCCVGFSPDGRWLVTIPHSELPGSCSVWDMTAGKVRHRPRAPGPGGFVLHAAFSPDSKYLATACMHRELVLWETATGKEVRRFPAAWFSDSVAFSPDCKLLAAASANGAIRL